MLHEHKATYYDVVAELGPPQQETLTSEGNRYVIYTYAQMQDKLANFLPFWYLWGSGRTSEHTHAILLFNAQGILRHI